MASAVDAEASAWASEATRLAHRLGVPISAGTDNSDAGPAALFLELEMLVDSVGLTPLEALTSATSVGAAVLGVDDEIGSIAEGMVADLVIYANDPTLDITRARHPVYVIKGGHIVRSPPER
jgi:imidazolonepropionase-like amidohydrolase